jgi:hypothetical protein
MSDQSRAAWPECVNIAYAVPSKTRVVIRVSRAVDGDQYPEEADPERYTTRTER